VFDDELMKKLDDNIYYAAFNVVRGKPGVDSLQTALENRHGSGAVAKIYKQFGTMRDIQNPATATMTKVAALNNMIWREFAKRKVMEAVMADPDLRKEWRPAEKVWTGKRLEIKVVEDGRVGTLIFMHKGEMVGFYGPRTMVDAFDSANPIENNILARGMGETSGIIKGLFTRWNPAFWPVAWWRDVRGFNRRMPGTAKELRNWIPLAGGVYFRYFLPAFRAAWSAYRGRPDAIAQEMLRTGQWISQAEGYMGDYGDMQPFERQLRRYGITSMEAHKHMTIMDRLALAWVKYNEVGQVFERTSKTVGHLFNEARRQTTPAGQRRIEVRRWAGSPDFLEHSAGNWAIESLAMFYNPFKEGMRSEFRAWKERPGETFANTLRWTILPMLGWSILYGGVRAALQGRKRDDLEDMAASIPDADRRCYKCIPLKWVDYKERKIMYLRIPLEEQERLIWASADIAIMAAAEGKMDGLAGLTDYAGRQLPSANPLIKLGADWLTYAMGGNPYDNFRGRNVLDQNEAELRGMMGLRAMGRATLNQTAGSIFGRIQQNRPEETPTTSSEKFLRLPMVSTVLGRWIKVSNRGYYEKIERATKPIADQEAQTRVDVDNMIVRMRKGKDITAEEATRLAQGESLHRQFGDKPLPPEMSIKRYFYTNFESEMKKVAMSKVGPEVRSIMRQPTSSQKIQAAIEVQRLNRPPGPALP
jgi:hypothetical protein